MRPWIGCAAVLGALIAFVGIVVAGTGALIFYAAVGNCDQDVFQTIVSPDNRWKAVVFDVNCGGVSDPATQISIVDAGEVFDAKDAHRIFSMEDEVPIDVRWSGNRVLDIAVPDGHEVHGRDASFADVAITYR